MAATAITPREWDAEGNPVGSAPAPVHEWDEGGNPVTAPTSAASPTGAVAPRGSGDLIDFDKLGRSVALSKMLSVPVPQAYDQHDHIHDELAKRGVELPTSMSQIAHDIKVGAQDSIFALEFRDKMPDSLKSDKVFDKFVSGLSTMVADLPFYIGGAVVGGAAGGAVGGALGSAVPVIGNVAGAITGATVGAEAGTFAIPAAIRESLVEGIQKGDIRSFGDLMERTANVAYEGEKGALTGMLLGPAGKTLPIKALSAPLVQASMKKLQQGALLTILPSLLEGKMPTADTFGVNMALISTLGLVSHGLPIAKQALMDVYAKDGTMPEDTATKVAAQPPVKQEPEPGLRPAIRITAKDGSKQVIVGDDNETHSELAERVTGTHPITIDELEAKPEIADKVLSQHEPQSQQVIDRAYEIKQEQGGEPQAKPQSGRGFATLSGDYMNHLQARNWTKVNEPDVHDMLQNITGDDKAEFHSEDYQEAHRRVNQRNVLEGDNTYPATSINENRRMAAARKDLNDIKAGLTSKGYARKAIRTLFVGQEDIRITRTRDVYDKISKLIPDYRDQESLSFYRDYKYNTDALRAKIEAVDASGDEKQLALNESRKRALNPSPELLAADRELTQYFTWANDEARQFDMFASSIPPDRYSPHSFTRMLEENEEQQQVSSTGGPRLTKQTPHAIRRTYDTIDDALATGRIDTKTVNSLESLVEYGDKHAKAVATRLLLREFKNTELGKMGTRGDVPKDWVRIAPHLPEFNRTIVLPDPKTGETKVISQGFYGPKIVAQALRPIVTPDWISNIPYFRQIAQAQAVTKFMELGFSIFHLKSEGIMMANNTRYMDYMNGMKHDITPEESREWAADGMKTSATQIPYEYWGKLKKSSLPTGLDKLREVPVISQIDTGAHAITSVIFDAVLPKFKVTSASLNLAAWVAKHPDATDQEYFAARRSIAQETNAVFGNLNWEVMGWDKNCLKLARTVMLAPDWTFSNLANVKYALEPNMSPGSTAARWFMFRSFASGISLTQAMSLTLSGQLSKHPTQVYIGKDKDGKDVYSNMFFAGMPKDAVTLLTHIHDDGPEIGTAKFISYKLGPLTGTGFRLAENKDWTGRPISGPKDTLLDKTGKQALFTAKEFAPFSATNLYESVKELLTGPREYNYVEFLDALSNLTGSTTIHEGKKEQQRQGLPKLQGSSRKRKLQGQ